MNTQITSPSLSPSYDTLLTLKADQTIRTSDNLNSLILSIVNPLLNIHSRIIDLNFSYSINQSSFTFAEVNPIDTVNEGLDQLLSILQLLDNDFIRPTHKLSNSLKSLRRRLHLLQENPKVSSTHAEPRSIRPIAKQSLNLAGTLMNKTKVLRRVLKDFIYWADTELMASLASSKPILANHQDQHSNYEVDNEFYDLIDQCVDIVQSSYQLNLFLRKLQSQCRELLPILGALTLLVSNRGVGLNKSFKTSLRMKVIKNHQFGANGQEFNRVDKSIRVTSSLVSKFLKSIDHTCLITVHRLMKRLEFSLEDTK